MVRPGIALILDELRFRAQFALFVPTEVRTINYLNLSRDLPQSASQTEEILSSRSDQRNPKGHHRKNA